MSFESDLCNALPPGVIAPFGEIETRYLGDWICRDVEARPIALARPRTTAEVSTVLSLCNKRGVPVVAQDGRFVILQASFTIQERSSPETLSCAGLRLR